MSRTLLMAWLTAASAWLRLAGEKVVIDGQRLDPTVQAMLYMMRHTPAPGGNHPRIETMRAAYRRTPGLTGLAPDHTADRSDVSIRPDLPARLYAPPLLGGRTAPLMVFFHGGGWMIGDLDTPDALCRAVAVRAGMRVLSVGYRLAPEHLFPVAFDDALAALHWARAMHPGEGIVLGGDSAGGNLAAAVAVAEAAAGRGGLATWLLYPALDLTRHRRSADLFAQGFLLTSAMAENCVQAYAADADRSDPRLSPLLASSTTLARLGPSTVVAAGFDPLRDHATAWMEALRVAGVPVRHRVETGLVHGFADYAGVVPAAREAVFAAIDLLRVSAGAEIREPAFA